MWIYLAMFACAIGLAVRIRRYDRHEREPKRMVALALALGFIVMKLAGEAEQRLLNGMRLSHEELVHKAAVVAMTEDGAKLLVVLGIACAFRKQLNDPLDGVVYGTLVGLGAAVQESLMYLSFTPPSLDVLGAEVTRLLAHSMFGGLVGFGVGYGARPDAPREPRPGLLMAFVGLAMLVHFAWNVVAYQPGDKSWIARAGLMGLMTLLLFSWAALLSLARRRSEAVFSQPAAVDPDAAWTVAGDRVHSGRGCDPAV